MTVFDTLCPACHVKIIGYFERPGDDCSYCARQGKESKLQIAERELPKKDQGELPIGGNHE